MNAWTQLIKAHLLKGPCIVILAALWESYKPQSSHEVPHGPGQKTASDFMDWVEKRYLIIVEYFSKYPILFQLHFISTPAVISQFTELFSPESIP